MWPVSNHFQSMCFNNVGGRNVHRMQRITWFIVAPWWIQIVHHYSGKISSVVDYVHPLFELSQVATALAAWLVNVSKVSVGIDRGTSIAKSSNTSSVFICCMIVCRCPLWIRWRDALNWYDHSDWNSMCSSFNDKPISCNVGIVQCKDKTDFFRVDIR